jgi:L-alanine-DL-glutamate epimerase-like enolase superfamily enzyme
MGEKIIVRIIDIRQTTVPIASQIRNAYINFETMTVSVVALLTDVEVDGKRVIGYGFNSNGRYAQPGLLADRFIPRILAAESHEVADDSDSNLDPSKLWDLMMANEKPGGHGERSVAVGTLDMAIWDAVSKISNRPLVDELAARFGGEGSSDPAVFVYAAGGYYYPGHGLDDLRAEMEGYIAAGFRNVKIKIGGASIAEDIARISAVIDLVGEPGRVAVDANGRFDLTTAVSYAKELDQMGLFWYEEPGDPLDFALQAELSSHYDHAMATGENLFSMQDARNLVRYGGMRSDRDFLQMDPVLSYGIVEYVRTLEMLAEHGWSSRRLIPHGGHQMVLHLSAALHLGGNELYPAVFQPFGRLAAGMNIVNGEVALQDLPGIGYEGNPALMDVFSELAD